MQTLYLKQPIKHLKDSIALVDESLMHIYYFYKKSSKKNRELKHLYGDGVRPIKATSIQWIDHKLLPIYKHSVPSSQKLRKMRTEK